MNSEWIGLAGIIVGAAVALVSTALSPRVTARQTHKHWLRDKRAESYEKFFLELHDILTREGVQYEPRATPEAVPPATSAELAARIQRLGRAVSQVQLYASTTMRTLSNAVAVRYVVLVCSTEPDDPNNRKAAYQEFVQAAHIVDQQVRKELNVEDQDSRTRLSVLRARFDRSR